jgi:acetylornithine deacetylase/succinyl-diaminopimelate desuccinylase-like protein
MRIVPPQQASEISRLAQNHIRNVCPNSVELQIHAEQPGADPVRFDLDHPAIRVASEALKQGFGKEAVFIREGGSIPVVATICSQLKCPVLLMGFGSESDNFHSPNEHFSLKNFENGIKTSAVLLNSI